MGRSAECIPPHFVFALRYALKIYVVTLRGAVTT